MSDAIASLLGALVGGLAAIGGAWLQARSTVRLQEEQRRTETTHRWDTKRLECYGDFAGAVKHFIGISQRVSAHRGLPSSAQPLDSTTGVPMVAAADADVNEKWESVLMLGQEKVITAAFDWRVAAWHIEWFARGKLDDPAEYEQANTDSDEARERFYIAVRADLGVGGGRIPDLPWPPVWLPPVQRPPDPPQT